MLPGTGEAVLVDFGLVRDDTAAASLTLSTETLGTPAYMAPEQIEPIGRRTDRRTDVYALGAVLFECLTLSAPFSATTRDALYRQILTAEPPDPRQHNPHVPRDLAIVTRKALEKDPSRRYGSALELAEELRRVRDREPIRGRAAGPLLRARRWVQRNPRLSATLAALLLSLAVGLVVSLTLLIERRTTFAALRALDYDTTLALRTALDAVDLVENEETVTVLHEAALAARERRIRGLPQPRSLATPADGSYFVVSSYNTDNAWMVSRSGDQQLETDQNRFGRVHGIEISPNGQHILVLSGFQYDSRDRFGGFFASIWSRDDLDAQAHVRQGGAAPPIRRIEHPAEIMAACITDEGALLTCCADGLARYWPRAVAGDHELLQVHDGPVSAGAISGDRLVTGGHDGSAWLWRRREGRWLRGEHALQRGNRVVAIGFDRAGERFVTATGAYAYRPAWPRPATTDEDATRLFDRDGDLDCVLAHDRLMTARIAPDGRHVITASLDQTVRLWRIETERGATRAHLVAPLQHDGALRWDCFDSTSSRIGTICFSGTAYEWDLDGKNVSTLRGHRQVGIRCEFVEDELVTLGHDDTIRRWSQHSPFVSTWRHSSLRAAAYSPDNRRIVAIEANGGVHVWNRDSRREDLSFDSGVREVEWLDVDGRGGIAVVDHGSLRVFSADGQLRWGTPLAPELRMRRVDFVQSTEANIGAILTAGDDDRVRRWVDGEETMVFAPVPRPPDPQQPGEPIWDMASEPGGERLAVAIDEPGVFPVQVSSTSTLVKKSAEFRHDQPVRALALSANGKLLCGTLSGTVYLWDIATGDGGLLTTLERDVARVAISPDGMRLAVAISDGTVSVLDPAGDPLFRIRQETYVRSLQFTSDGRQLLIAYESGLLTERMVETREFIEHIRQIGLPGK